MESRRGEKQRRRRVTLEGCFNFRDLGGYPAREGRRLRWGRLYRSDSLHALTPRDLERLAGELRIGEVVDLRTAAERTAEPSRGLDALPLRQHHLPLYDGTEGGGRNPGLALHELYFLLLRHRGDRIARVIETVAATDEAVVFHCAAGKDRTGIIAAAILGLLGVDDEVITRDYALTKQGLGGIVSRLESSAGYREMLAVLPADTLHAEPDTMRLLLERVRGEWGGFDGWARTAGLPQASRERLERVLE